MEERWKETLGVTAKVFVILIFVLVCKTIPLTQYLMWIGNVLVLFKRRKHDSKKSIAEQIAMPHSHLPKSWEREFTPINTVEYCAIEF